MATAFGISGLKSKFDDWRGSRRHLEPQDLASSESRLKTFENIGTTDGDHDLSRLLENLVIPKLIANGDQRNNWLDLAALSHANDISRNRSITSADVEQFAQLSLSGEAYVLLDFVDQCLATGSSVETIFVELLAPAARRLGEYWDEDSEDIVGVTMGLWRIQEILRELTLRIPPKSPNGQGQRSALFAPVPGEQHSLGTLMVAECFQRAGWDADVLIEPTQSELNGKLAKSHYDLIGLTVSCDSSTGSLSRMVNTIKAVSSNPNVRILIGGRVINEQPELVERCGADATAIDALSAVAVADLLVPANVQCLAILT